MLTYPQIDPIIVAFGPLKVRWYGLMYVLGFGAAYFLVKYQLGRVRFQELAERLDNLNLYLILGVILGGRLGYVFFYQPAYFFDHPLEIFATWQGGMSFHGGCIGVILAGVLFCAFHRLSFWKAADLYVVTIPFGLGFGRIGNFINGELFGRPSEVPWAMVFPGADALPRHPSQLYEALLEGVLLFVILWAVRQKPWQDKPSRLWPHGSMLALFLILYGMLRIIAEQFREPDPYLGLLMFQMTMGQLLSTVMIVTGLALWGLRIAKK